MTPVDEDDDRRLFDVGGRETDVAVEFFAPEPPVRARVNVRGERLTGESDRVLVKVDVGSAHVELSLTPREARSFASDIEEAARVLEGDGR